MRLAEVKQLVAATAGVSELLDALRAPVSASVPVSVQGASGSLPAFVISALFDAADTTVLCITPDADSAASLESDLEQVHEDLDDVLFFPPTGYKPFDKEQLHDPAGLITRADALQALVQDSRRMIVTSAEAIFEKVPERRTLEEESVRVKVGDTWKPEDLIDHLVRHAFEHVEFIEEPGQLALRGGILDVYPFAGDFPFRLEFFGDEVDSIREIDIHTQRSVSRVRECYLVPNLERPGAAAGPYAPLFDFLGEDAIVVTVDEQLLDEKLDDLYSSAGASRTEALETTGGAAGGKAGAEDEEGHEDRPYVASLPEVADLYLDRKTFRSRQSQFRRVGFGSAFGDKKGASVSIGGRPQPSFNSSIKLLKKQLAILTDQQIKTIILCDSHGQLGRLQDLLERELSSMPLGLRLDSLHEGFELAAAGVAVYTDHQIFDRYHRPSTRRRAKRKGGISLRELRNLTPGDFVVHVDYGIGRFAGLKKIRVRDRYQESVRLEYRDDDVLYVNINALHKLHRYTGKEGHHPRLTKLGSGQWEKTKARTKKRVKDIARDLIKIYARRLSTPGYAFPPDTLWQREMEASFQYEDTPDQGTAAEAVKSDMERPTPMDRLVCGDVGFGKTEIAVRAAFKAVQDGKQVALLVPTTILASQHNETFNERLGRYPVSVEMISRFRSKQDQQKVLAGLERGEVDIVIGTHRLTSKDIRFKNLGLIIIDEEQRFGVAAKEKLRALRAEVDTLTLTATPIPRTLQFSLMGARDLSIVATPPPNRQPIATEIHTFDKHLIRDAIRFELSRNGQVFFIHNRVQSIEEVSAMLRSLLPDVRIQVAHGQMKPSTLERVMFDFKKGKFDVLVSTNIIENGLDIANANTMIINRADRFGLAELHQLRGRVGRSNRKAFCYLLVPTIHGLTREARQRLQAVEEFSDLGSGFNLAMRDLDIRGAGAMLGAEQSGFIEDVGFETYHRILDEAVQELRSQEFSDVFKGAPPPKAAETSVDLEEDALIPDNYLSDSVERLNMYRRISEASTVDSLEGIREELDDRFGSPPPEVDNLMIAMELRILGQNLRLTRVAVKNERLFLTIPKTDDDPHFYETIFHPLLAAAADLQRRYVVKESRKGLTRIIVQEVERLDDAIEILRTIESSVSPTAADALA